MAKQIQVSSEIDRRRFLPLGTALTALTLAALGAAAGCDKESPEAEPVQSITLEGALASVEARQIVGSGLKVGFSAAARESLNSPRPVRSAPDFEDQGVRATFIFTANNHGEREDCGCRSNPLGGLGRRHTMIDYAREGGVDAEEWWGKPAPPATNLFVADAGDLFYKNVSLTRSPEWSQKAAKIDARTVADSVALARPDAYVASENDLVFGLDELKNLTERAGLTTISANLFANDERVFPASTIAESDDLKVAYIGITQPAARLQDYYKERNVEVKPFIPAYKAAAAELPADVDLVVLLSNAGVPETQKAVSELADASVRVDLALVSNSNRLLRRPNWASGVPLVEPLSRGKWLGRVDLILRGDDVDWVEGDRAPDDAEKRYRRSYSAWLNAQQRLGESRKKLLQARISLRDLARTADAGQKRDGAPNVDFLEKRVETLERQVGITVEELGKAHAALDALGAGEAADDRADDEIAVRTSMLKLDIPEEARVRRLIDRDEKKKPARPKKPAGKVVPPRPTGHGGHGGH